MTLVRHTITAIERDQADATASGKQVVAGAVVTMTDSGGSAYQMADNAAGANASTSKTTNSDGQVTVYVEPGQYTVTVNGISSGITVGNGFEVTQSPTDTTAGRLLKVGDFGVGGFTSVDVLTDTQGIDKNAFARGSAGFTANLPRPATSYNILNMAASSATNTSLAISWASDPTVINAYIRAQSATYTDWIELASSGNNALIEFGSNANGSFTKFPDGTLVCYHNINSSSGPWTYPSAFNSVPRVSASVDSSGAANRSASTSSTTATSTNLAVYDTSNTLVTTAVNLIAIGRWK